MRDISDDDSNAYNKDVIGLAAMMMLWVARAAQFILWRYGVLRPHTI